MSIKFLLFLFFNYCTSEFQNNNAISQRKNEDSDNTIIQVCGHNLANTLSRECKSVYKKHDPDVGNINEVIQDHDDQQEEEYFDYPFRTKRRVHTLELLDGRVRRQISGVATECCWKPCTLGELRSYCGSEQD